jgi:hypothetical protein
MIRVCKKDGLIVLSDLNKRGQRIVADLHRAEDRVHRILGWSMNEVEKWFVKHDYSTQCIQEECETVLVIHVSS